MSVLLLAVHAEKMETSTRSLGVHRIAHYLRRNNIRCDVCEIGIDDDKEYLSRAERGEYFLIGLSSTYNFLEQELTAFLPYWRAAARCRAFTCAGGQSPSRAAAFWIDLGFDGVIRGYGELPVLALAQRLAKKSDNGEFPNLEDVPSLTWRNGAKIQENPAMQLTADLFRELNYTYVKEMGIPPAWLDDLSRQEPANKHESHRYNYVKAWSLYTSHKCPNRCGYCSTSNFLEQVYSKDSAKFGLPADDVIDLITFYHKTYGISFFNFLDDDFASPKRFTREFCEKIISLKSRGILGKNLVFYCLSRVVDFLDLKTRKPDMETLQLMKDAGFHRISFGVENFSERMLRTPIMHKKGYNDKIIMNLIRAAQSLNIEAEVNFMIGVPEAEPEDVRLNLERLVDVQEMNFLANLNMCILCYPGAFAFKNPSYPAVSTRQKSPLNGWEYSKFEYLVPKHPLVRDALIYYMETGVREAVEAYKKEYPGIHVQELRMLTSSKRMLWQSNWDLTVLCRGWKIAFKSVLLF